MVEALWKWSGFLKERNAFSNSSEQTLSSWILFDHFCVFVVIAMKEESSGLRPFSKAVKVRKISLANFVSPVENHQQP